MPRRPGRGRGALEAEVLACLAAADHPMTVAEVQADVGRGELAYTTVLTTLVRLHAKQALTRSTRGRAHTYALTGGPVDAQSHITAHQMRRLLDAGSDRAGVLMSFVADLTEEDERVLAALLTPDPSPPLATGGPT